MFEQKTLAKISELLNPVFKNTSDAIFDYIKKSDTLIEVVLHSGHVFLYDKKLGEIQAFGAASKYLTTYNIPHKDSIENHGMNLTPHERTVLESLWGADFQNKFQKEAPSGEIYPHVLATIGDILRPLNDAEATVVAFDTSGMYKVRLSTGNVCYYYPKNKMLYALEETYEYLTANGIKASYLTTGILAKKDTPAVTLNAEKQESDPHGKSAHEPGSKLDEGKNRLSLVLHGFAKALEEVGRVGTFGAKKYTDNGWVSVPEGVNRYTDAAYRHLLKEAQGELQDPDSNILHAAHTAWNALARLELILRRRDHEKV
jgi:hypothetical protein